MKRVEGDGHVMGIDVRWIGCRRCLGGGWVREEKAGHARIEPSRERKGEVAVMVDGCHEVPCSGEVERESVCAATGPN